MDKTMNIAHILSRLLTGFAQAKYKQEEMKHYILTFLACILFTGCFHSSTKSTFDSAESLPVPTLDLGQVSYPKNEADFEETVKYIPLETTNEVIIDGRNRIPYCSDNRIVVLNTSKGDIFVFDGQGEIVSHFNHNGQGPEEYLHLYAAAVVYDEIGREIFVMEKRRSRCQVYSEDGSYLRTFSYPKNKQYSEAYSFDRETLLVFDENMDTDSAYVFLSKKDGKVLSCIEIPLLKRLANFKDTPMKGGVTRQMGIPRQQLLKDGDDFILAEMSSDTIYRFTRDKRLIPVLTYTPSIHDSETPVTFQPIKVTGKCVFGFKYIFDLQSENPQQPKAVVLIYDIEKRQAFQWKGSPNIDYYISAYRPSHTDMPANLCVQSAFPDRILENLEKGELEGKIKEVAEKLKEDDNPVIQVIKFK